MRFLTDEDRSEEHKQIGHPDDCQEQIDIPLGLGVFAAVGDAKQVTGCRHHNEELVAPEHEPGEIAAPQPRPRRLR